MTAGDNQGARLRVRFREIRDEIAARGEIPGTAAIVKEARQSISLTPQEEDLIWDSGWAACVKSALRGVKVGAIRGLLNVTTNGGRKYEQLVLLSFDEGRQVRDEYRDRSAENERFAIAWTRVLEAWAERGTDLLLGEAIDADEFVGLFGDQEASGQ